MSTVEAQPSAEVSEAIFNRARDNVPPLSTKILNTPFFPALITAMATFLVLVLMKPQFVQREHSSSIALPKLNYGMIGGISFIVFILVLAIPYFISS